MARPAVSPTGNERSFDENEIIVSKTDLEGRITYANEVFVRVSGFSERELLGAPHNLIRHPDMPRCVFQFLWGTLAAGDEIFAYVVNLAKNGDHYWVLAHVTPTFDESGQIVAYHSNRRVPDRSALEKIKPVYELLLKEEQKHASAGEGLAASSKLLLDMLGEQGVDYHEFVWSLQDQDGNA